MLAIAAALLASLCPGDDMPKPRLRAGFLPAPPIVRVAYGQVPANLNGDSQAVGAYADPANQTIHLPRNPDRFARGHETAHLFDSQVLNDAERRYFQRLMHAPSGPWDHGEAYGRVEGNVSPAEWFADYYGAAVSRMTPQRGYSVGSFAEIGPKRMLQFEAALKRLAARRNLPRYK